MLHATSVLPAEEETLDPDWAEQDGQEQLEELLAARLVGLQNEKEEVRLLLDLARRCQPRGRTPVPRPCWACSTRRRGRRTTPS